MFCIYFKCCLWHLVFLSFITCIIHAENQFVWLICLNRSSYHDKFSRWWRAYVECHFLTKWKRRKYVCLHFCALQDLRGTLEQELDFINEGRNSERCAKDLSKFSYIYVPKVLWNLSTKVLHNPVYFIVFKFEELIHSVKFIVTF